MEQADIGSCMNEMHYAKEKHALGKIQFLGNKFRMSCPAFVWIANCGNLILDILGMRRVCKTKQRRPISEQPGPKSASRPGYKRRRNQL